MALLSPVTFDISFLRFHGGSPLQCGQPPSMQANFRTRALQKDQFPPQNYDKMSPAVRSAFEKARLYKKKKEEAQQSAKKGEPQSPSSQGDAASDTFDQSKAYGWKQGEKSRTKEDNAADKESEKDNAKEDNIVEVEIITRDGVIKRKYTPPSQASSNIKDYRRKGISSIDFVGLDFADKKPKRGLPAGLKPVSQSPPSGSMPEVEIIVGDVSKFGVTAPEKDDDASDLYKPKVSTWGVFPRPKNISKTYGGGKVIRPGDVLESKEEKAAREARTKKIIDAYKEKMGENVDPKVKAKCEKVLKEGNNLMEAGRLRDAIVYYERIMNEMVFKSELHGLAALQWSICLDSLNRSGEARVMYEKLTSHPNLPVRKKARQLIFGFQAMKMMKVSGSYSLDTSDYQKYFEAFTQGYNTTYKPMEEEKIEDTMGQLLPYVLFLLSPIALVFTAAAFKGF